MNNKGNNFSNINIEKEKKISDISKKVNVNGNILYFCYSDDFSEKKLKEKGDEILEKEELLDSVIFLNQKKENSFSFAVYEKNGTFSKFCGNGIIGSTNLLYEKLGFKEFSFLPINSDFVINSKINSEEIEISLDAVYDKSNNSELVENLRHEWLNFGINTLKYNNDDEKLKNETKNDKNLETYIKQLLNDCGNDENFSHFLEELHFKGFYEVAGEPHVIIEISNGLKYKNTLNYYLKLITFVLRNSNKEINTDVNLMFYFIDEENKANLYPSERGVQNGFHLDQTGACGSGSIALGNFLNIRNDFNIKKIINRSGFELEFSSNGMNTLIAKKENIKNVDENEKGTFSSNVIIERLKYKLSLLGYDLGDNYEEILDELFKKSPKLAKKINKNMGNVLFSSCFHESEFPIDPYKITSSISGAQIANSLHINQVYSPYLDTLNGDLKTFPNINTKQGKILNDILKLIKLFKEYLNSENNTTGYKHFIKYIKLKANTLIIENPNELDNLEDDFIKEKVKELEELCKKILGLNYGKNINNSEYGKFILSLLKNIGISDEIDENLGNNKNIDDFKLKIVNDIIKNNFNNIFLIFIRNILSEKFDNLRDEEIKITFYKVLQNTVLNYFIQLNCTNEQKKLLTEKKVLDEKKGFSHQVSSKDKKYKDFIYNSINDLINDPEFSKDFLLRYFSNLAKKSKNGMVLLGKYNTNDIKNIQVYYFIDKNGTQGFCNGKDKNGSINSDYFFEEILGKKENIVNVQGSILILLLSIGNILTIGSERQYREITSNTLKEHFPDGKYDDYSKIIESLKLTSDYDPKNNIYDNGFPAGTDNTPSRDLMYDSLLSGSEYMFKITQHLINNNIDNGNKYYINDFIKMIEKTFNKYNFNQIIINKKEKTNESNNFEFIKERLAQLEEIEKLLKYDGNDTKKLFKKVYYKYLLTK